MTYGNRTAAERKAAPITTGVLDYFPDALLAVGELSRVGNEQHNPGQPLHWAKEKSSDEADALVRHLLDRGTFDTDGVRHSAKVAWRALALLQRELDAENAPQSGETLTEYETQNETFRETEFTIPKDMTLVMEQVDGAEEEQVPTALRTMTEDEFWGRQAQSEVVRGPLTVSGQALPGQREVHNAANPNSFHSPKVDDFMATAPGYDEGDGAADDDEPPARKTDSYLSMRSRDVL